VQDHGPPGSRDKPRRIAIVTIGSDMEALTLRQVIECFGEASVDLLGVGKASHLIAHLRGKGSKADHIVLCCHGDEEGIILPELHPSVAAGERYLGRFGAEAVRKEARLRGRVVLSTGCSTAALAEAFLAAGAAACIAPDGDPEGPAPLAFLATFYYRLLTLGSSLTSAFRAAKRAGGDCKLFQWFEQ